MEAKRLNADMDLKKFEISETQKTARAYADALKEDTVIDTDYDNQAKICPIPSDTVSVNSSSTKGDNFTDSALLKLLERQDELEKSMGNTSKESLKSTKPATIVAPGAGNVIIINK